MKVQGRKGKIDFRQFVSEVSFTLKPGKGQSICLSSMSHAKNNNEFHDVYSLVLLFISQPIKLTLHLS